MAHPRLVGLLLLATQASCGGIPDAPRPAEEIDARWNLKAGDVLAIKIGLRSEGEGWKSTMELDGLFRVRAVGADGVAHGTSEVVRHELQGREGGGSLHVLYEGGELRISDGFPQELQTKFLERIRKVTESKLLPTGIVTPNNPEEPTIFTICALGVELPGRRISRSESWKGRVHPAHCDEVETEYRFGATGDRLRIIGRSTAKAEIEDKIRIRVEGIFLPREGYVSEGTLEIDFSPLGSKMKSVVRFSIERR